MSIQLGDTAPDFKQDSSEGLISFHEWLGDSWGVLFSHPADFREGDLLVTSGMGQRFPVGYPVAVVSEVQRNTGQPFTRIQALPAANLNRSRYLLLVFSDSKGSTQALDQEVENALEDAKQLLQATETTAAEAQ